MALSIVSWYRKKPIKPIWSEVFWLEKKIREVCQDVTKVVFVFDDEPGDEPYVVSLPYFNI